MNWRVRECDGTSDRVWGDELLREEMKEFSMQSKNEGVGNREKRRKVVNRTILYIEYMYACKMHKSLGVTPKRCDDLLCLPKDHSFYRTVQ